MSAIRTDDRLEFVEYRQRTKDFIPLYEPVVTEEMRQAVLRGYDEQLWIRGSRTWESQGKKFEEEICKFIGCDYAVNVTSGTAALLLALKAFGIGSGDEVITVPNTFPAPTDVIMWAGATPVYVDMDLETYCIDVSKVEAAITPRTKAIMPVDAHGHAVDMDSLLEIARRHNLIVIDDACQAIGSGYKGQKVGVRGHCATFSYTRNKPMTCGGDGGLLVTNDRELAEMVWMLANHGRGPQYYEGTKALAGYQVLVHEVSGLNFRQSEVLSAVARVNLRHLQEWNERRRVLAARYTKLLNALNVDIVTPSEKAYAWHSYWRYVIRTPQRDKLRLHLSEHVETKPTYATPNHLDRVPRSRYGFKEGDFPTAERFAQENLALPMYPGLTDANLDYIVGQIASFYRK